MNDIGVDIIGQGKLNLDTSSTRLFIKGWWGQASLEGATRMDSYYIHLIDQESVSPGDTFAAKFKFKFSSHEHFNLKVEVGQIILLFDGSRLIGELLIKEIVNPTLKKYVD